MAGFSLTRTVGLPSALGDIGNWLEPLGLAPLFVEGVVLLLAVIAIRRSSLSTRNQQAQKPQAMAWGFTGGPRKT